MGWKSDEFFKGTFKPPYAPLPVGDVLLSFPAGSAIAPYIPPKEVLPDSPDPAWERVVSRTLYGGFNGTGIFPKEGIDPEASLRHIAAVMRTFSIKHEYKICAVTFLMQQWWKDVIDDYDQKPGSFRSIVTGEMVVVHDPNSRTEEVKE